MNVHSHQLCLVHLLRNLIFLTDLDSKQTWSSEFTELIRESIHKRKTEPWEEIDRSSILVRFEELLAICTDNLYEKIIALIKSLTNHKEFVFRFLFVPNVPSTVMLPKEPLEI